MEDKEILELFRRRSEKAIASASDKYKSYCMKIAVNILGTRQDAEECVNDTFFKAWELIHVFGKTHQKSGNQYAAEGVCP